MKNTKTYNGWTNWETWNVLIWLDNSQNLYNIKQSFINKNVHDKKNFESIVKLFLTDIFPHGTQDMNSIKEMKQVNFKEIADTWIDEHEFESNF